MDFAELLGLAVDKKKKVQEHILVSIDAVKKNGWLRYEQAEGLKSCFSSDETALIFTRFVRDPEWSKNGADLKSERLILQSLSKQMLLGKWLDLIHTQANKEATEKLREACEELSVLYASGRHALK